MLTDEKAVSADEKKAEQISNNTNTTSIPINTSVPNPLALFVLSDKNEKTTLRSDAKELNYPKFKQGSAYSFEFPQASLSRFQPRFPKAFPPFQAYHGERKAFSLLRYHEGQAQYAKARLSFPIR